MLSMGVAPLGEDHGAAGMWVSPCSPEITNDRILDKDKSNNASDIFFAGFKASTTSNLKKNT